MAKQIIAATDRRNAADKMVQDFRNQFYTRYGIMPRVIYNIDSMSRAVSTMEEIETAVNTVLEQAFPKMYKNGIKTTVRENNLVQFKNLFYFIGLDEGWTQGELSRHIGHKDHTSAFHAQRKVEALMEDRHMQTLIYHSDILALLRELKAARQSETTPNQHQPEAQ